VPLYADESDPDDDLAEGDNSDYDATPKAKKQSANARGKKRVSDAYHVSHSQSNSSGALAPGSSPSRVPLKAVNINDDEAEKRKRRKSAKLAQPSFSFEEDQSGAGPSSSQDPSGAADTPRARQLKQKQQLMSVAEAPVVQVPLDVMSSNFEEWMKMATDNVCTSIYCSTLNLLLSHM
jgi:condensin complex subunit 2